MKHPVLPLPRCLHGLIALACLLPAAVASAASPPFAQAVRFAVEGRADVARLPLAGNRNARTTVAALCRVAGKDGAAGPVAPNWGRGGTSAADRADTQVLKVIGIPPASRGSLRLRFETADPMIRASIDRAAAFITLVVASNWLPKSEIRIQALGLGENRAYSTGLGGQASVHLQAGTLDVGTAVHELAHHIEGDHRLILEVSKRFLARRARGGTPERLRDLTGLGYGTDEISLRANWTTRGGDHYSGKFYGPSLKNAHATELISMGLERLHREPAAFFREDADYFLFLMLVLQIS